MFFDLGARSGQVQLDNISLVVATTDDGDDMGSDDSMTRRGSSDVPAPVNAYADLQNLKAGVVQMGMADSIVDGIFTANVATAGNAKDVSLKQNLTLDAERFHSSSPLLLALTMLAVLLPDWA